MSKVGLEALNLIHDDMARVLSAFFGYNAYLSTVTPFYAPESAHEGWCLAHGELAPLQDCAKVAHDGHKHHEKPHSLAPTLKRKLNGFTRKTRTSVNVGSAHPVVKTLFACPSPYRFKHDHTDMCWFPIVIRKHRYVKGSSAN